MRITRFLSTVAATVACAVAATGCSGAAEQSAPPTETAVDVRHDVEGLAATVPAIGVPESVAWVQWSDGAGARWTDAVVRLSPVIADAMVAQFEPADTGHRPQVQDALAGEVPAGPFLTGELLDAGFSSDVTSTYAFLDRERSTLVLQATSLD